MEDNTYFVVALIYLLVGIVLIAISLIVLGKYNKKKYNKILTNLEIDKNLIISGNILTELNKVSSLINNNDLEKRYNNWKERYKEIKEVDVPKLDRKLNELEALIKSRKYKLAMIESSKLELDIYFIKSKSEFLLNEIKEISLSESKNREIVTKLKKDYRDIYLKYHNNPEDYEMLSKTIELQFENIDKLFNSFELAMENNDYVEAPKIVKALGDTIGNIDIVVDEAPAIIIMGKSLIPTKMEDIRKIHNKMVSEGYVLDYLNLDYNIAEAEKKIADIFDRLKVLNLTDSVIELQTILNYFESLYGDLDKEKQAKKEYQANANKIGVKCNKLLTVINKIANKIEDIKFSYDLTDDEVKGIDDLNLNIKAILSDYELIVDNYRSKSFPFTSLAKELNSLNGRLVIAEDKLELTIKNLNSFKEDEKRAREQLEEIKLILKSSKEKINNYKLPIIPENYYIELSEATDAIEIMTDELAKKPISIKTLNLRVDTARDLVLKLYKNTSDIIKNAILSENTIIYGNRYRDNNKINNGLAKAENYFYEGKYKESLKIAVDAISEVDPYINDKLIEATKEL